MTDWLRLIMHTLAAAMMVRLVTRSIAPALASPALSQGASRALLTDLWLPVALIAPLLGPATRPVENVPLWSGRAASPAVGLALLACAAVALGTSRRLSLRGITLPLLMLALSGAVVLLLAAANRLSIGVGQTLFACAVVLMWVNTPRVPPKGAEPHLPGALIVILLLAAAQTAILVFMSTEAALRAGVAVVVIQGAMIVGILARHSPAAALSIGGWTGVYGAMLCVGMVSVARLVRSTFLAGPDGDDRILQAASFGVASGFAHLAIEGALLVLGAASMAGAARLHGAGRITVGVAALLAGAGLIAWRLGGAAA